MDILTRRSKMANTFTLLYQESLKGQFTTLDIHKVSDLIADIWDPVPSAILGSSGRYLCVRIAKAELRKCFPGAPLFWNSAAGPHTVTTEAYELCAGMFVDQEEFCRVMKVRPVGDDETYSGIFLATRFFPTSDASSSSNTILAGEQL